MLTYNYEVKGMNLQTSFFIDFVTRQARDSKFFGLEASVSPRSSDALLVELSHADSKGIQKFVDWLKSASKGASKVQSIRKL